MRDLILLLLVAYLFGSIPFGKLIAQWFYGVNIQKRGSGNIGFANVTRVLGWKAGIPTLLGDVLKGIIPAYTASLIAPSAIFWVGLAAIAGHIFPLWLRFRGGKGIATGLGVVIILNPLAAVIGGVSYIIGRLTVKKSSIASLIGVAVVLVVGLLFDRNNWWHYLLLTAIACWTLRHNILGTVPAYDI